MSEDDDGAPIVAADRFPVSITGAVEHVKVRAVFTQPKEGVGRLVVWISPETRILDTVFRVESSVLGNRGADWVVDTDEGEVVIKSLGGCGCGDRLKNMIPWQPYRLGRPLR